MDLKDIQTSLFNSLDELENISDTLEYNSLSTYCLLSHIINENLDITHQELSGFREQNELIKKSVDKFKEKLKDIHTQLRELK